MIISESKLEFIEKIVRINEFQQSIIYKTLLYFWEYLKQRNGTIIIEEHGVFSFVKRGYNGNF